MKNLVSGPSTPVAFLALLVAALLLVGCPSGDGGGDGSTDPAPPPADPPGPKLVSLDLQHTGLRRALDGTPVAGEYTMQIEVGTPAQTFDVVMDSGSSNLILKATETQFSGDERCKAIEDRGNRFDASASSTGQAVDDSFQITYGSGGLSANEFQDTVAVAGAEGLTYTFGLMTEDQCVPNILGLAYESLANPRQDPLTPYFDALVASSGIDNVFTMTLCGASKGGKIDLGGASVEATSHLPITAEEWYVISPDYLGISGTGENLGSFDITTIVDSGTTELVVTQQMFEGIHNAVKEAAQVAGLEFARLNQSDPPVYGIVADPVDLSSFPTFTVVAGEQSYDIAPTTYFSRIEEEGKDTVYMLSVSSSEQTIILGQVFMENYVTVFDRANTRLGFAPIAGHCD